MKPDSIWHQQQVARYMQDFPCHQTYAATLRAVLQQACLILAPLAIVQTRAKAISSFAEKAARKAGKYSDPVHQLTDLCGGRVIAPTQAEADAICEFIKASFDVDWANSVDKRAELKSDQFGYLSVHYVIQISQPVILGIPIPSKRIGGRKAEIQVRTLMQHAWSEVTHDRLYKSSLNFPEALRREGSRLAAASEELDRDLARLVAEMDRCAEGCLANLTQVAARDELQLLQLILQSERDGNARIGLALRIARLAQTVSDDRTAIIVLSPLANNVHARQGEVLLELGRALTRSHADNPQGVGFRKGVVCLETSAGSRGGSQHVPFVATSPAIRSEALALLAGLFQKQSRRGKQVREWTREAYWLSPRDPRHLLAYAASETRATRAKSVVDALRPQLQEAITVCVRHLEMGGQPIQGWFALTRLHLLLEQRAKCLRACAKAIEQMRISEPGKVPHFIEAEIEFLGAIEAGEKSSLTRKMHEVLKLSLTALAPDRLPATLGGRSVSPALILMGDAGGPSTAHPDFRPRQGSGGFPGKIIRGNGENPVSVWKQLIGAGIRPPNVLMVCEGGDESAEWMYRLALGLGATVGLVLGSGGAADAVVRDPAWAQSPNCVLLPSDTMTLRAFVHSSLPDMDAGLLEVMGQAIHTDYVERNKGRSTDPSLAPWSELPEDLKNSNLQQAAEAAAILRAAGFQVRASKGTVQLPAFTRAEIERMAEMEHGRWNVERLRSGWALGPKKDVANKISPHIRPWSELPEAIRDYDRQAVLGYPKTLALAGLSVVRSSVDSKRQVKL